MIPWDEGDSDTSWVALRVGHSLGGRQKLTGICHREYTAFVFLKIRQLV